MALDSMKDGDVITDEVLRYSVDELVSRTRLLETEVKIMKSETMRISHELQAQKEKIKENTEKIKVKWRCSTSLLCGSKTLVDNIGIVYKRNKLHDFLFPDRK